MNTTSTKQLSAPQRAKIAAQCDAVQSAAAALSFQWATIKSYRGWSARYAAWLCLHAPADLHSAAPVSWPCCERRVWGFRNRSWTYLDLEPDRCYLPAWGFPLCSVRARRAVRADSIRRQTGHGASPVW